MKYLAWRLINWVSSKPFVCDSFRLEKGEFGVKMVVTAAWTDQMANLIIKHRIPELELNYAKGWKTDCLEYMKDFSHLKWLRVASYNLTDFSFLSSLRNLESLSIDSYCQAPIDFTCFPKLKDCGFYWHKGCESLFTLEHLEDLFIYTYGFTDFTPFKPMKNLRRLCFKNAARLQSCQGISALANLEKLELALCVRLTDITELATLQHLTELHLDTCSKINSIEPLRPLKNLEWLNISNNKAIETLEPIFGMSRLKRLGFCESTDILDGNLRPLLRMPALKDFHFMERKHYNLTWYERDTGNPPPPTPEKKGKGGTVYDVIAASPVFPGLKRLGFKRTRLVWNRTRGELVDVIVIRASAFDPKSFQVWVGVFSPQIQRILWDNPEGKQVREFDCLVRETLHLLMKRKSSFSIETEAGIQEVNEQLMGDITQFALPFLESIVSMRDIRLALEKNYRPGKHNGMNWNEVLGLALAAAESGDAPFARSVLEDYRSGKNSNDTFAARVEAHIEK